MMFGSVARGESDAGSDVDVLALTGEPAGAAPIDAILPAAFGPRLSVCQYSEAGLRRLVADGSLFALHLQLEGRILADPEGRLARLFSVPVTIAFAAQREELAMHASTLFAGDVDPLAPAAHAVARHLLRTAVFLECARAGEPTFSARRAARVLSDETLVPLLRRSENRTRRGFDALRSAVCGFIGHPAVVGAPLVALASTSRFARQLLDGQTTLQYDTQDKVDSRISEAA